MQLQLCEFQHFSVTMFLFRRDANNSPHPLPPWRLLAPLRGIRLTSSLASLPLLGLKPNPQPEEQAASTTPV